MFRNQVLLGWNYSSTAAGKAIQTKYLLKETVSRDLNNRLSLLKQNSNRNVYLSVLGYE